MERRTWIPMADGIRLAATLYLPGAAPAPVLLEALPYRKDDLTAGYAAEYARLRDEHGTRSRGWTCAAPAPRRGWPPTSTPPASRTTSPR